MYSERARSAEIEERLSSRWQIEGLILITEISEARAARCKSDVMQVHRQETKRGTGDIT